MHSNEDTQETSLRDLFFLIFRQKKKILCFFFAVVTLVTAGTFLMPEVYRSEAKLMIRLGREKRDAGSNGNYRQSC